MARGALSLLGRAIACAFVMVLAQGSASAQDASLEQSVKATFLYRFASFVTWPAEAFPETSSPVVLCVAGAPRFRDLLEGIVQNQRVAERPIVTRAVSASGDIAGCHILYLPAADATSGLQNAGSTPVLTVTDGGRTRGMVHFVVLDNRVRFHIDEAQAAQRGLSISSRLLNLAVSVRRRA